MMEPNIVIKTEPDLDIVKEEPMYPNECETDLMNVFDDTSDGHLPIKQEKHEDETPVPKKENILASQASSSDEMKTLTNAELGCIGIAIALALKQKTEKRLSKLKKKRIRKRHTADETTYRNDQMQIENHIEYLGLDDATFEEILTMVRPKIEKKNTVMRDPIPSNHRLSICLRYLVTGESFQGMRYTSAISPQSIGKIIMETCTALIHTLKDCLLTPQTESEWKSVANEFQEQYNFPHCVGVIDGKHISIVNPPQRGPQYMNYEKFYSIILLTLVNANHEFIMVDASTNGRNSDVLSNTPFGTLLVNEELCLPVTETLANSEKKAPYVFVGNESFPLLENLMKPYAQDGLTDDKNVLNEKLSCIQKIGDDTMDILSSKFRVLQTVMHISPEKSEIVVLACCYLHNYFLKNKRTEYLSDSFLHVENTSNVSTNAGYIMPLKNDNFDDLSLSPERVRETFCEYFNNEVQSPMQF